MTRSEAIRELKQLRKIALKYWNELILSYYMNRIKELKLNYNL